MSTILKPHTRMPLKLAKAKCSQRIPFDWVLHLTFQSSIMRFWIRPIRPVNWQNRLENKMNNSKEERRKLEKKKETIKKNVIEKEGKWKHFIRCYKFAAKSFDILLYVCLNFKPMLPIIKHSLNMSIFIILIYFRNYRLISIRLITKQTRWYSFKENINQKQNKTKIILMYIFVLSFFSSFCKKKSYLYSLLVTFERISKHYKHTQPNININMNRIN